MRQGLYLFSSMIKQNLLSSFWMGQVASELDRTGCVWIEGKSPFPCQGAWGISSRPPAEATPLGHELKAEVRRQHQGDSFKLTLKASRCGSAVVTAAQICC